MSAPISEEECQSQKQIENESPNENIIIKFKLSDIKQKPKSLLDSESEQDNSQDSNLNQDSSNYSSQSKFNQSSSESKLQSFEKDLQNNLMSRAKEQEFNQDSEEDQLEEKIEKRIKMDSEMKQQLYSHEKTIQKNQKRQYLKQNQHIKESYAELPVSKERMLQLSLKSAQKFQQKLLNTNIFIRPLIKKIEDRQEKGEQMTSKEGFPANNIPFLIRNERIIRHCITKMALYKPNRPPLINLSI